MTKYQCIRCKATVSSDARPNGWITDGQDASLPGFNLCLCDECTRLLGRFLLGEPIKKLDPPKVAA